MVCSNFNSDISSSGSKSKKLIQNICFSIIIYKYYFIYLFENLINKNI